MAVTKRCEVCGKKFSRNPSKAKKARFCSAECSKKIPKRKREGKPATCKRCGKVFYRPPSHKAQYCSYECASKTFKGRERAPRVTTRCWTCGKEIRVRQEQFDKGLGHFCSRSCRSKYYPHKHPAGTELVEHFTVPCSACGKPMRVTQAELDSGKQFCSNKCVNVGRHKANPVPKVKCQCLHCGKEFEVYPCWAKKGDGKFCCRRCVAAYYRARARLNSPTSIERALMNELDRRHITYSREYAFRGWSIDIAIPDRKLAAEADGDYWHSLKNVQEKDARKDKDLAKAGWTVLHFSESEINKSPSKCVDKIVKHL